MIAEGAPDSSSLFRGGAGTANMIELARAADIEVVEVGAPARSHA